MYPETVDTGLQESETECCVVAVPEPLSDSGVVEVVALLLNERVPDAAPLVCGTNFTVNDALFPAAMVKGKVTPLKLNSELLTVAEDTVTDAPAALKDALMLLLLPTTTLPKLNAEGLAANCPAVLPVPDKEIDRVLLLWP